MARRTDAARQQASGAGMTERGYTAGTRSLRQRVKKSRGVVDGVCANVDKARRRGERHGERYHPRLSRDDMPASAHVQPLLAPRVSMPASASLRRRNGMALPYDGMRCRVVCRRSVPPYDKRG